MHHPPFGHQGPGIDWIRDCHCPHIQLRSPHRTLKFLLRTVLPAWGLAATWLAGTPFHSGIISAALISVLSLKKAVQNSFSTLLSSFPMSDSSLSSPTKSHNPLIKGNPANASAQLLFSSQKVFKPLSQVCRKKHIWQFKRVPWELEIRPSS